MSRDSDDEVLECLGRLWGVHIWEMQHQATLPALSAWHESGSDAAFGDKPEAL